MRRIAEWRRHAPLTVVLGAILLLAACAEPEPESPVPVHPSEAQGIQPPPGVELTESECLVGGWRVAGEPLRDYLRAFGPGTDVEVGGHLTLGFTVDRYYVEPRVGITWQNRGEESLASFVGESEGSYRIVDGMLEAAEERDDLALVDVDQGQRSSVDELFLRPVTVNPITGASVACSGDALSITTTVGGFDVRLDFARVR
ncbi:MAG: hypothetical protein RJQ01_03955 [Microcella sp.]|uniref:hypothetical protein n=1 Tax=Microcella sp. TaxID=1913979 RepID=UPI0033145431